MGMTVFSNFGGEWTSRQATPEEEVAEAKRLLNKKLDAMEKLDADRAAAENLKEWRKRCKTRGLKSVKTKSQYAWRSREQKAASPTVVKRADVSKPETWSFVNPGEPAPFDFDIEPRLRLSNPQRFEICVVTKGQGSRRRVEILAGNFKLCCEGEKQCYKNTCARCWCDAYVEIVLQDNQYILIRETITNEPTKVVDPSGVDPRGSVNSSRKALGEDEKGMFSLTSKGGMPDEVQYKSGNKSAIDGEVDRLGRLIS